MTEQTVSLIHSIGKYCRIFRIVKLGLTLKEVAEATNSNEKSLSHFEHGRANNIQHLVSYAMSCQEPNLRAEFYEGLTDTIREHKAKESVRNG